ncbi:MAG: hypothetical protein M0R38_08245 [Bacteroidia bacterium]|nr:hypothetical protein [Bacteroidia bacterium]
MQNQANHINHKNQGSDSDVMLVGFDLTESEVKGTWEDEDPPTVAMEAGWFFVLEERAGDTRFGLQMPDINDDDWDAPPDEWADLHWGHIADRMGKSDVDDINFIDTGIALTSGNPFDLAWAANAANMGTFFCRNASKVMIHAETMLNKIPE